VVRVGPSAAFAETAHRSDDADIASEQLECLSKAPDGTRGAFSRKRGKAGRPKRDGFEQPGSSCSHPFL
jgi:hypothetical protein